MCCRTQKCIISRRISVIESLNMTWSNHLARSATQIETARVQSTSEDAGQAARRRHYQAAAARRRAVKILRRLAAQILTRRRGGAATWERGAQPCCRVRMPTRISGSLVETNEKTKYFHRHQVFAQFFGRKSTGLSRIALEAECTQSKTFFSANLLRQTSSEFSFVYWFAAYWSEEVSYLPAPSFEELIWSGKTRDLL